MILGFQLNRPSEGAMYLSSGTRGGTRQPQQLLHWQPNYILTSGKYLFKAFLLKSEIMINFCNPGNAVKRNLKEKLYYVPTSLIKFFLEIVCLL